MLVSDLAGTLIRPEPPVARQYLDAANNLVDDGALPSYETVESRFHTAFAHIRAPGDKLRYGSTDTEGLWFWKRVISCVFPTVEDDVLELLVNRLYVNFEQSGAWEIFPEAESVLQRLKRSGWNLVVLTNWDSRAPRLIKNLELFPYFDEVIVSSRVGVEKPDTEIFELVRERMEFELDDPVMIGNHVDIDLVTPDRMGWDTVLFTPESDDGWAVEADTWSEIYDLLLT
ncbi:MAG: HAD-IA family hydrolase [bacterium]